MKKGLIALIISTLFGGMVFGASRLSSGGGSPLAPGFWKLDGTTLAPTNNTWTVSTTASIPSLSQVTAVGASTTDSVTLNGGLVTTYLQSIFDQDLNITTVGAGDIALEAAGDNGDISLSGNHRVAMSNANSVIDIATSTQFGETIGVEIESGQERGIMLDVGGGSGQGMVVSSTSVYPIQDNFNSLGKSGRTWSNLFLSKTITAGGTTGAQTINRPVGSVNFAAGTTTLVVTNNLVTTNSVVIPIMMSNDLTAVFKDVEVSSGSFLIRLTTAPTAETKFGFIVF